jgi:hypothetical protein
MIGSIDEHKSWVKGIKVDPPSKIFTKLVNKNAIKPEKVNLPPQKNFTTSIYPTPETWQKPHGPSPWFLNDVHL